MANLDVVTHPTGHPERTRRIDRINNVLAPIAYAPEPATRSGPDRRARRQLRLEVDAMRAEAEQYDEGHPVRREIFEDVGAATAELHKDDPVPGSSRGRTSSAQRRSGPGPPTSAASCGSGAKQPVRHRPRRSPSPAPGRGSAPPRKRLPPIDWRERWGASYGDKHEAFERALKLVPDERYEQFRAAGLNNMPRTVELLVALGERLAKGGGR
jgi:hypothetical protein